MLTRTRVRLVPCFALCATGLLLFVLVGCRKEQEKPVPSPNSPAAYMNDPVFRKAISDKRAELQAIVKERQPLAERMQALVKEHGENLAVLQEIPEWKDLYEKVKALNVKYEEVRRRQLAIARERLGKEKASK